MPLVVGASGLVGAALMRAIGANAIGTFRTRPGEGLRHLDAHDRDATRALIRERDHEAVYFPAAEPNVDWCESHPEEAYAANVVPALMALALSRETGAAFIFFSSDYVFDGASGPYDETAPPAPLSVYGRHKLEVEERVLAAGGTVIRTASVFGQEPPPGKNFVLRLVARLSAGEVVTVPFDQHSTPTWSDDLARGAIAVASRPGLWHAAGPDFMARHRFAELVAEVFGLDTALIQPVRTADLGQAARRPLLGGLRSDRLAREMGIAFAPTRDALSRLREQQRER